jgi:hypothetical protein
MFRTLLWIYSILYTFLLIFYLPLFIYRVLVQGKDASILFKRIGGPPFRTSSDPAQPSLWIHAVSVGEVKAIEPLVDALTLNRDQLFISTITDTGQSLARSRFQDRACVFYFPFDWNWICHLYLRRLSPTCVLLAETEIWPGFISAAESLNIPVFGSPIIPFAAIDESVFSFALFCVASPSFACKADRIGTVLLSWERLHPESINWAISNTTINSLCFLKRHRCCKSSSRSSSLTQTTCFGSVAVLEKEKNKLSLTFSSLSAKNSLPCDCSWHHGILTEWMRSPG